MRKIFSKTAILLALALLFAGCQKPHLSPSIPDTAAWDEELQCFQFPGTRWGMTQEEWIEAWNLSEEDYEALSDDPYQINGAKETINYQVCQPLDVWEYPARILVIFSDFEGKEPVLVAVKAVFPGEDEEAVVGRFQEEFHSDTAGYNNIVDSPGTVKDLDANLAQRVYEINESWGRDPFLLDQFGLTFYTWEWDAETKEVTLECNGIAAAMVHLAKQDEVSAE